MTHLVHQTYLKDYRQRNCRYKHATVRLLQQITLCRVCSCVPVATLSNLTIEVYVEEVWKDIVGFEQYQISSLGRVKKNTKIMSPWILRQGYLQVGLTRNKVRYKLLVHRLVAEAFICNEGDKDFVNHKNLDKSCNYVSNLEWVTKHENVQHFIQIKGRPFCTKYAVSFKEDVANFSGGLLESARYYGIPTSTISRWRKLYRRAAIPPN